MVSRSIHILLVEDNPGDVELTKEAFSHKDLNHHLHVAEDGDEAMDFLYQRDVYSQAPRPDIVLLDLNLPGKDGREILTEIKSTKELRSIPIIILSSSEAAKDIKETYDLHANCFVTKPVTFEAFVKALDLIEHFWTDLVKLPQQDI